MNLIGEKISYKPDEQFHLNDVSFNFKKGNLYTILGRTLSGKTTLLKTIAGLLNPDQGSISFEEKDFIKIPVWERNVAMVYHCLLYTSPSPRDQRGSRMPSSA